MSSDDGSQRRVGRGRGRINRDAAQVGAAATSPPTRPPELLAEAADNLSKELDKAALSDQAANLNGTFAPRPAGGTAAIKSAAPLPIVTNHVRMRFADLKGKVSVFEIRLFARCGEGRAKPLMIEERIDIITNRLYDPQWMLAGPTDKKVPNPFYSLFRDHKVAYDGYTKLYVLDGNQIDLNSLVAQTEGLPTLDSATAGTDPTEPTVRWLAVDGLGDELQPGGAGAVAFRTSVQPLYDQLRRRFRFAVRKVSEGGICLADVAGAVLKTLLGAKDVYERPRSNADFSGHLHKLPFKLRGNKLVAMPPLGKEARAIQCASGSDPAKVSALIESLTAQSDRLTAPVKVGSERLSCVGLHLSALQGIDSHLYLNAEMVSALVYRHQPLKSYLDFLVQSKGKSGAPIDVQIDTVNPSLSGLRVFTLHTGGKMYYRLRGIVKEFCQNFTFKDKNGKEMSVHDYFKETYPKLPVNPKMPLAECGTGSRKQYLPLETVFVRPEQNRTKMAAEVDPQSVRNILKEMAVRPAERQARIRTLLSVAKLGQHPVAQRFGLEFKCDGENEFMLNRCNAELLDSVSLQQVDKVYPANSGGGKALGEWARAAQGSPMDQVSQIRDWAVLLHSVAKPAAIELANNGAAILSTLRDRIMEPHFGCKVPGRPIASEGPSKPVFHSVVELKSKVKGLIQSEEFDVIFVVFADRNEDAYACMKQVGDCHSARTATQCVLLRNVTMMGPDTGFNIALKINAKLAGVCWRMAMPPRAPESNFSAQFCALVKDALVLGVALSQSARGSRRPHVAAVVGNTDDACTVFGAAVHTKVPASDLTSEKGPATNVSALAMYLGYAISERIGAYVNARRALPKKLFVLRQSSGDSMLTQTVNAEYNVIMEVMKKSFPEETMPKVTFIVCQNRNTTACHKSGNVPAGTLLRRGPVSSRMWDFYLVSQMGIQGTSRPCRYVVAKDENGLDESSAVALLWPLTHMFARCPRSVSLPAPVYYARLACERASLHMRTVAPDSGDMSDGGLGVYQQLESAVQVSQANKRRMYFL